MTWLTVPGMSKGSEARVKTYFTHDSRDGQDSLLLLHCLVNNHGFNQIFLEKSKALFKEVVNRKAITGGKGYLLYFFLQVRGEQTDEWPILSGSHSSTCCLLFCPGRFLGKVEKSARALFFLLPCF